MDGRVFGGNRRPHWHRKRKSGFRRRWFCSGGQTMNQTRMFLGRFNGTEPPPGCQKILRAVSHRKQLSSPLNQTHYQNPISNALRVDLIILKNRLLPWKTASARLSDILPVLLPILLNRSWIPPTTRPNILIPLKLSFFSFSSLSLPNKKPPAGAVAG